MKTHIQILSNDFFIFKYFMFLLTNCQFKYVLNPDPKYYKIN